MLTQARYDELARISVKCCEIVRQEFIDSPPPEWVDDSLAWAYKYVPKLVPDDGKRSNYKVPFAHISIQEFVRAILNQLPALYPNQSGIPSFSIEFDPQPTEDRFSLGEYVGWLVLRSMPVANRPGAFVVFYRGGRIAEICGKGLCQDKTLGKIFLHELAHAILHYNNYVNTGQLYCATQNEENEAHVLSGMLWAVLAGEYGNWSRVHEPSDLAWASA